MPLGFLLSVSEKEDIIKLSNNGWSHRKIAKEICRSKTAITNFLKEKVDLKEKKRYGPKEKLNNRDKRRILREASNKVISCRKIAANLNLDISRWTVNRAIKKSGIIKYLKKKTSPPLTDEHKRMRLKWARDHMTWNEEWQKVVWSDEKKFNLDGPDGLSYYWHDLRKDNILFSTRAHGGGSVMIWAAFGWNGQSEISFIESRLNAKGYQDVLKNHLINIGKKIGGQEWIFQQDNAPIHRAKVNILWFERQKINVLPWPSLSPDLNPMENLWGLLTRKVYANGCQFYTTQELKSAIIRAWTEVTDNDRHQLVNSMPNRIYELIRLNGAKTNY